ncbi:MAG: BCCT family transporter [Clostridiaceae bacterium]|jgi:BCCT family betaine/carnitine transporter|nr:BCCT family transporter [Clostridiaceae bacterium]
MDADNSRTKLNKLLFALTAGLLVTITALFIIFPSSSEKTMSGISKFCVGSLGSFYLWGLLFELLVVLWISFSKIGKVKLGDSGDKPQYSFMNWIGMIFTSSTGCSVLYWALIEWSYYYKGGGGSTPWGADPGSWQAGEWATAYSLFHNGLIGWAIMAVAGVTVSYIYYIRKTPILRISEICRPVLGRHIDGFIGIIIDFCVIFGMASGIATSMGFAGPLVAGAVSELFNIAYSSVYSYFVLLSWAVFSVTILVLGLEKGFAKASDGNIYLFSFFLAYVFITGPSRFIIDQFTSAIGKMCTYFFSMALWTDAIGKSNFPQDWTIFFWAWWVIFAPTMGLFYAKISKGRTIRELALGVTIGGSIGIYLAYGILGSYALSLDVSGIYPAAQMILQGLPASEIIAKILINLPFYKPILVVFIFLAFIYTATTIIAVSYTFAAATTERLSAKQDPAKWNRIFWVVLLMAMGTALMKLGGLNSLKAASIISALPLLIICLIITFSLVKMLKEDGLLEKEEIIIQSKKAFIEEINE